MTGPWSQAEVDELRRLCAKGYPLRTIAKLLDRKRSSIVGKKFREGISVPKEAAERNRMAGARAAFTNPTSDKARRDKIRASFTPERRERARQSAARLNSDHPAGSPARRRTGAKAVERFLGWCPPQYRDEYRALKRKWGMTAEKTKAAMLEKIPPFEMKLWHVQSGARLVGRPDLSRTYDCTLGGGSPL